MNARCAQGLPIVALLLLSSVPAEAQQIAGTFDQLRVLIKQGDTLTITDGAGQRMQGKLSQLSTSSLVLDVSGALRQFHESDVNTIERRGPDSLKNGALIGLGIGGALGALALGVAASEGEAGFGAIAALVYSGLGAGIGVGFDALLEGRRVIYVGSTRSRATLNLTPIVNGRQKGVLLGLSFQLR